MQLYSKGAKTIEKEQIDTNIWTLVKFQQKASNYIWLPPKKLAENKHYHQICSLPSSTPDKFVKCAQSEKKRYQRNISYIILISQSWFKSQLFGLHVFFAFFRK